MPIACLLFGFLQLVWLLKFEEEYRLNHVKLYVKIHTNIGCTAAIAQVTYCVLL